MKYTIITGASSGIGKALAFIYAKSGHHLILSARRYELLLEIKKQIEADYGVLVECVSCDLNDLNDVKEKFTFINGHYSIECLINNAGIGIVEDFTGAPLENIQKQTNINVIAPTVITQLLLNQLKENNGSLINICSVLSYVPNIKSSIYVSNKYALLGLSNTIRLENPRLHVLTVHPKTVKTAFLKDDSYYEKVKSLDPNDVAQKIYKAYCKKKRKLNIPKTISFLNLAYQIAPGLIDRVNRRFFSNK